MWCTHVFLLGVDKNRQQLVFKKMKTSVFLSLSGYSHQFFEGLSLLYSKSSVVVGNICSDFWFISFYNIFSIFREIFYIGNFLVFLLWKKNKIGSPYLILLEKFYYFFVLFCIKTKI